MAPRMAPRAPGAGLPVSAIDWLACPVDGAALSLSVAEPSSGCAAAVVRGTLSCSACARRYPIEDGIPRLLPDAAGLEAVEAVGKQAERQQRDREAGIYDRNLFLRLLTAAEAPATLRRLGAGLEDVTLEVGCGTGRFTARLAGRTRALLALDHSVESLRIARAKVGDGAVFVQADASYLPVRTGWATRVLSCQMLEHIPTPAARRRAVHEMARALA